MRTIPAALQSHIDGAATTLCFLLKITARDGSVLGVTSHDQAVTYDDGAGEITYSAVIGVDTVEAETTAGLEVDNSEATLLLVESGEITAEKIEAGMLDYGRFVVYRVNYKDLSQGHYIPPGGVGYTGIAKSVDGLKAVIELRGLPQWLKQNYGDVYSVTCRAKFGGPECKFNAASLWQNHSITAVDAVEPDRIFTANAAPSVSGPNGALSFVPGLVEWLTGDNAGKTSEVEAVDGAIIYLRFGTEYTIQATDTFKIRPDCDKFKETCRDDFDNLLEFRGEPHINGGNESASQTPGALSYPIYPGLGVATSTSSETDEPATGEPTSERSGSFTMPSAGFYPEWPDTAGGLTYDSVVDADAGEYTTWGVRVGDTVTISGSASNDGTYLVGSFGWPSSMRVTALDGSRAFLTEETDQNITITWTS